MDFKKFFFVCICEFREILCVLFNGERKTLELGEWRKSWRSWGRGKVCCTKSILYENKCSIKKKIVSCYIYLGQLALNTCTHAFLPQPLK